MEKWEFEFAQIPIFHSIEAVLSQPHFVSLVYKYSVCPFLGVLAEFFALKIF